MHLDVVRIFPPNYLNTLLLLEIGLHLVVPIKQIIRAPNSYLGVVLSALAIALNSYSVWYLEQQNTTSNFSKTADKLVVTGPFRRSRNPLYLSGVVLSAGIAVFLGSLITFTIPIAIFLILNSIYIPVEEQRLEELFSGEYLEYKRRVRRWL